ncbi:MAG: CoA pyrophosphatase [Hahellaceae bacterium]|nr:CoA pyrophosphatase [Hahellaceae bacterium]MCP5212130.1 CoA pyrophosphatase [Hahellaceae bacterium]
MRKPTKQSNPLGTSKFSKLVRKLSTRAAVAIVITTKTEKPEVLLIKRAIRDGDPWSGDIAFPGGKQQTEDRNTCQTALRELFEETGITPTNTTPTYRLPDKLTRLHHAPLPMTISPWIFETDSPQTAKLNHESTDFLWLPLAEFLREDAQSTLKWKTRLGTFTMPTLEVDEHRIWGITLSIIHGMIKNKELFDKYFADPKK